MTTEEIRKVCIDGSQAYYDHLDENGKGIHIINIHSIEKVKEDKLKLKINSKIFDEETLVFKYLATNQEWSIEGVKIQVYDRDTNTLVVKPKPEVYKKMANANVNDWQIISDLKFLIERVKQWYILNGKDLKLPNQASRLKPPKADIYLEGNVPSIEQEKALEFIFEEPLSYIWGAPGTGKTQFVLSYAILHYLANNKKVAIVAPTNHALEQIYRGVIKMTDLAGIDRDQILRLGGPSKKFADEFPEVCEIIGLENQLKQLDAQIAIIENILGIDSSSEEEKKLEKVLDKIKVIEDFNNQISELNKQRGDVKKQADKYDVESRGVELKLKSLQRDQETLRRKRDSFFHSISKVFGGNKNYDEQIDLLLKQEAQNDFELNKIKKEALKIEKKAKELYSLIQDFRASVGDKKKELKTILNTVDLEERSELSSRTPDYSKIKSAINTKIESIRENRPIYETLATEYKHMGEEALILKHEVLKEERDKLANYSTEERLKNVSIVGATLDTYLYRFREDRLNADHIFLDEAGYSNIIKALTLFNQGLPVTFLGDHMQLPPVCEISKRDIQNDTNFRPVMVWDQSAIFLEALFVQKNLDDVVRGYLNGVQAPFQSLKKTNLTGTFRFGKSLANVLQQYVYKEGFSSKLNTETEIILYDVKNLPENRRGGRLNSSEVDAIVNLVNSNFTPESSVAILAPYSAQVRAIGNRLSAYQQNNKVLTVHKSQGQEWDTVIYSVCDIGNGKRPWFTDSQNTLSSGLNNINTAISRAKKRLIIVCNPDEWRFFQNQLITGILNAATKKISV
ncbi:DEAD/DEAH box helicase [Flagellimonas marinaquae]